MEHKLRVETQHDDDLATVAAFALQGILANPSQPGIADNTAAIFAFDYAEAFIAERDKRKRGEAS